MIDDEEGADPIEETEPDSDPGTEAPAPDEPAEE
jgi:hypothetical protein